MKIAITSQGKEKNSQLDPRFGRCSYILIYNIETDQFELLENTSQQLEGGAGIQTAQKLAENKVQAVITGHIGPNAFKTLSAAGIAVYSGNAGAVDELIDKYKNDRLQPISDATVEAHHGMNADVQLTKSQKKKIAVAVDDAGGLQANVSAHFGRCPYYVIIDAAGNSVVKSVTVENPFFNSHGEPGQVPAFIKSQKADVIISGGMGPRAVAFFNDFGIDVVTGASGSVDRVIRDYLNGSLSGVTPCKETPCS
jgi:predicted Fe-Mo cluster-binding NifX family protein